MRSGLRATAMVVMALLTVLASALLVGEALADPGGVDGVLLVAAWLVPLVVLGLLAWYRPDVAAPVLVTVGVVVATLVVWSALDPQPWHDLENRAGPLLAVAVFVLAAPLAVLGWHRPLPAGLTLVGLGVLPFVSVVLLAVGGSFGAGTMPPQAAMALLSGPLLLVGALLVATWALTPTPSAGPPAAPGGDDAEPEGPHNAGDSRDEHLRLLA